LWTGHQFSDQQSRWLTSYRIRNQGIEDNRTNGSDSGLYINKLYPLEMKPGAVTFYNKNVYVIKVLTLGSIICLAIRVNVLRSTTDFCEGLISVVAMACR
jgi:hypothetical protein